MSATKQTEREKQLEAERDDYQAKYEAAVGERDTVTTECDDYQAKYEAAVGERDELQHALNEEVRVHTSVREMRDSITEDFYKYRLAHGEAPADTRPSVAGEATAEVAEPSEEEYIKDLLRRNGLKKAYLLPTGPCFSEEHARQYAGADFDTLTVITAE